MQGNCLTTTVNQAIREVTWRGRSASMPQIPVNRVGKERFVVISRRWRRYMSNISQASLFQSSSTNLSCPLDDLAFDKVELPVLACLALVLPMRVAPGGSLQSSSVGALTESVRGPGVASTSPSRPPRRANRGGWWEALPTRALPCRTLTPNQVLWIDVAMNKFWGDVP
jgi:hypothetical protein